MSNKNKYRGYFDIDDQYFAQINDSSIAAASSDFWKRTYPHKTFIEMLTSMERILARQEKRSIWIEGAYGTGKSQCSYAMKKILDVPEAELCEYWNMYESLKKEKDLLEKLVGHKKKGVVTAYRYAAGGIFSPRDLFFAVQDSVKAALSAASLYEGEHTLKESVIAWIDKPANKRWLDELLLQQEYSSMFAQSSTDEILKSLHDSKDVKELMTSIFRLADKEGITALDIDADRLIAWLSDIIDKNNIKVVLIWDEFADYFKNNRESLSEFQRLAELVNLKPFYFIIVTHESGQLFTTADTTWKKIRDRFIPVNIALPDNIAFELIGHAFKVKEAAKEDWKELVDKDLYSSVYDSYSAVMKATNTDEAVMKKMMPLQPMAALVLKNIASAFKSNQRSMFNFIKAENIEDVKAFQWFIDNKGPYDDHPLLTVDMLWNFFYEKGKGDLAHDIRLILDTFPQQQNLREDEKAVLKAILIMQAIDQRLGGMIDLFKATEQHLSYVFEGIPDLRGTKSANIAKRLKEIGILITNPISGGRSVYVAAVLAGDQAKIDKLKNDIRQTCTTSKLVADGGLSTVLALSPALRLRYETEPATGKITPVTTADFSRTINTLRDKSPAWNFHAVIAFAKDDVEAAEFRKKIKATVSDEQYKTILFIDALSTSLGTDAFELWIELSAMAMYYQGSNNTSSRENAEKAKRVLDQDWKHRVYNGQFIVYSNENQTGEKVGNAQGVSNILQTVVTKRFQYAFDFKPSLTESQLKATHHKQSAKAGILESTSGVVVGIEKIVLPTVWKVEKYWEAQPTLPISKIKIKIDKLVADSFSKDGQISIREIYDYLEEIYGFAPCNLSAFLTGFILKEYGGEPFRYSDSSGGHEPMTHDKLAEMIGNYIGKNPKPTYLVKMTPEEKAFYKFTEKVWKIPKDSCSSATQASSHVVTKMREFGLPVWCLEEVDKSGIFYIVQKYMELVKLEGNEAHKKAVEIGRIASAKPSIPDSLLDLLSNENCQNGMRKFLKSFEDGKIMELAKAIGAEKNVLSDIRRLFEVEYSSLWDEKIGKDEIRKLLTDYGIVKESNSILNASASSLSESFKIWHERLKFIGISYETLQAKYPVGKTFDILLKIYQKADILPEQLKIFHSDILKNSVKIKNILANDKYIFTEVYKPYLDNLSDGEIAEVKSKLQTGLFEHTEMDCNEKVKIEAEEFRKNQLKSQLFNLWKGKTKTKNPNDWSSRYRTPILCCVPDTEYDKAKKAFDILNRNFGTDSNIKEAIEYLEKTDVFTILSDDEKRNRAFELVVIGEYRILLGDLDKVRDTLELLSVDTYDWYDNPGVKNRIKQIAETEYNAGGSAKALKIIDKMNDEQLKQYLKRLVKDSITVGVEILANEDK